jgi:hypothetical protein
MATIRTFENGEVEWIGLNDLWRFGLSRSTGYNLIEQGAIRSVNLRIKGTQSGRRLIDVLSLRDYLNSLSGKVDRKLSAKRRKAALASAKKRKEKAERKKAEANTV